MPLLLSVFYGLDVVRGRPIQREGHERGERVRMVSSQDLQQEEKKGAFDERTLLLKVHERKGE